MRSRLLGAVAGGVAAVLAGACSEEGSSAETPTLPPIQTTTTAPTTTAVPAAVQSRFYEVQEGDTLTGIAEAYGLPIPAIMRLNGIDDPNAIYAGQILELPEAEAVASSLPGRSGRRPGDAGGSMPGTTTAP